MSLQDLRAALAAKEVSEAIEVIETVVEAAVEYDACPEGMFDYKDMDAENASIDADEEREVEFLKEELRGLNLDYASQWYGEEADYIVSLMAPIEDRLKELGRFYS